MLQGSTYEFETQMAEYTEVYIELEPDSIYRLDMYDADNSEYTTEHIAVFSNAYTGERRCHAPKGRPAIFRAPSDGVVKLEVTPALEGAGGTFGLQVNKFNMYDFETNTSFDLDDPAHIHLIRLDVKAGDRRIKTRAQHKDRPPIFLNIQSLNPQEVFLNSLKINAGTSWEANDFYIDVPSRRYVHFIYTSTYYHEPNRVHLTVE